MTKKEQARQSAMERVKAFFGDNNARAVRLRRSTAGILLAVMSQQATHHGDHAPHIEPREVGHRSRRGHLVIKNPHP